MEPLEIRENATQFVIIFGRDPDRVFGIDVENRRFIIEEPGEKGFRPAIQAGELLAYDKARAMLRFVWTQSDGQH